MTKMAELNYFQTYTQRENHVTNNTLLMLRHVYRYSPLLMERLLSSILTEESPNVGLHFQAQKTLSHQTDREKNPRNKQVPDGYISQDPLHIYVEAKLNSSLTSDQLIKHSEAIIKQGHPPGSTYLIGISAHPIKPDAADKVQSYINECSGTDENTQSTLKFFALTYAELVENLKEVSASTPDLEDIVQDYESFLESQNLLPDQYRHMAIVLSGRTFQQAIDTGVFFEDELRRPKWYRAHILGLYHHKMVSHIGRLVGGFTARPKDDDLEVDPKAESFGQLTEENKKKILRAIKSALDHGFSDCKDYRRYYVVDKFIETNFRKSSSGGLMGNRYINLQSTTKINDLMETTPIETIASRLSKDTFS